MFTKPINDHYCVRHCKFIYLSIVLSNTKRCAAENDVWKETPQCSVTRASDTESCSLADGNGIINFRR